MIEISAQQWVEGIADNTYVGIANIRNLRIDDVGTLRLHPKPTKILDTIGNVIKVQKGYYDTQENWIATIDEIVRDGGNLIGQKGRGAIYQSLSGNYSITQNPLSGSVVWRDYMFTFNKEPNTASDLFIDEDGDGRFERTNVGWEVLVTQGQTQARFNSISNQLTEQVRGSAILDDTHIVILTLQDIRVYELVNSSWNEVARITERGNAVAAFDGNNFAVMTQNTGEIIRYNWDGVSTIARVHAQVVISTETQYINMSRMNSNTVCAVYHNGDTGSTDVSSATTWDPLEDYESGDIVEFSGSFFRTPTGVTGNSLNGSPPFDVGVWVLIEDDLPDVRFSSFEWNGRDFDEVSKKIEGAGASSDPYIVGLTSSRVVIVAQSSQVGVGLLAYQKSFTWELESELSLSSLGFSGSQIGPLVRRDSNEFLMLGQRRASFNYDNINDELSILNDNLVGFKNAKLSADQLNDRFLTSEIIRTELFIFEAGSVEHTPAIVGQDDAVYWANGNNVGRLIEESEQSFNPEDSSTYNLTTSALDLPKNTVITSLSELGQFLVIGTKGGKIYFWDRFSDSFQIPVNIGEEIAILNNKNNVLYAITNDAGNVYLADFTSYKKEKSLSSFRPFRFQNNIKTEATTIFDDGIYFGASVADGDKDYTGIWIYRNGSWTIITPSVNKQVTALTKISPSQLIIATNNSVDIVDIAGSLNADWNSDEAYLDSGMRIIGDTAKKGQLTKYDILLEEQMKEEEYFAIQYRTTVSDEFIEVDRVTGEQMGTKLENGLYGYTNSFSTPQTEQIEVRFILNTTAGVVKLKAI